MVIGTENSSFDWFIDPGKGHAHHPLLNLFPSLLAMQANTHTHSNVSCFACWLWSELC